MYLLIVGEHIALKGHTLQFLHIFFERRNGTTICCVRQAFSFFAFLFSSNSMTKYLHIYRGNISRKRIPMVLDLRLRVAVIYYVCKCQDILSLQLYIFMGSWRFIGFHGDLGNARPDAGNLGISIS